LKIWCYILKRDRTIREKGVNPDNSYFEYNDGIYQILAECVNVSAESGTIASVPELYYVEDIPQPINYKPPPVTAKGKKKQPEAPPFLEKVLIENAIEGLAGGPSELLKFLKDFLMNPARLLIIVFAIIILIAFLSGMIGF